MFQFQIQRMLFVHALAAATLLQSIGAQGDTEVPRVVLGPAVRDLEVGPGMNAAGRDLRGCEFVGQDLTGAVFDGCNLYGVRIHQCGLKGASFRGAIFAGAEVTDIWGGGGQTIEAAHFSELEGADFTDATVNGVDDSFAKLDLKLSPHQLMSTRSYNTKNLRRCVIYGSDRTGTAVELDLHGADLRHATLCGDLSKCDLTDARFYQAALEKFTLTFKQLASTRDFRQRALHVRINSAHGGLTGKWDFSGIHLEGSELGVPPRDADFTDATVNGCSVCLSPAQMVSTRSYKQGNLVGLRVMGGDLSGLDFSGMNLTGCRFLHCKLGGARFEDAVITDAWFLTDIQMPEQDLLTIDQIKSTWSYKHGHMEGIRLPEELAEALKRESREDVGHTHSDAVPVPDSAAHGP